jgi:hypothetical protein
MSFNPSMLELAFNQDEMCPDDGDQVGVWRHPS